MDKKRILIVEDDKLLRDLYLELLGDEGFEVDDAADGETGSAKALAGGYDLILLDIMLPKKDGLEILDDLKNNKPQKPNGSIVMLTNLGHDEVIKQGLLSGASGYLIKSALTPDEVLHQVHAFLAQKE